MQKVTTDEEGEVKLLFVIAYSKANKRFTTRSVKVEKDYGYIHCHVQNCQKNSKKQEGIQKKPSKASMLSQHQTAGTTTSAQNN